MSVSFVFIKFGHQGVFEQLFPLRPILQTLIMSSLQNHVTLNKRYRSMSVRALYKSFGQWPDDGEAVNEVLILK